MTTPATELDFDSLKSQIINYIKADDTFKDYNFEGSTLNAIIDLLAYNTHTNAYYANMVHNEGFLDTAQKRGSVVSKANELGYTPKSVSGSTAFINITSTGITASTNQVIRRGTTFRSSNELGSFEFVTVSDYIGSVSGSTMTIEGVKIVNGKLIENKFKVDLSTNPRNIFNIPNKNIDTSTLIVSIRPTAASTESVVWNLADNSYHADDKSLIYYLKETYDGYFQIYFGDNIVGASPVNGNVIDISYLVSNEMSNANGCRLFYTNTPIGTSDNIETSQVSFGGSDKESIDSIRYNAKISNTSKERAVTTSDYELVLKEKFNFIKSVSVWGGENNVPPVYGKVFASIQPVSGYTISSDVKNQIIIPELKKFNLITITPELVDPEYISIELITNILFDYRKTSLSRSAIEETVKTVVSEYITSISAFNTNYIESDLIDSLKHTNSSIVSNYITKKIGFNVSPVINVNTNFNRDLNNSIKENTISSTKFYFNNSGTNVIVSIKEIPNSLEVITNADNTVTQTKRIGLFDYLGNVIKNIGFIDLTNGVFSITLNVASYITSSRFVAVRCETVKPDIIVNRNQIIKLDTYGADLNIGLNNNNVVLTQLYA